MNTLFDKIWDKHVVQIVPDGPTQLYIDRLYCHEVTSPQAFAGMRARGLKMFRPDQIFVCLTTILLLTIRINQSRILSQRSR